MTIPKYCGSNDPLLSYTTRLHPQETHTTHRLPINSVSFDNEKSSDDTKEIKTEIKTEPEEISNINLGMNQMNNNSNLEFSLFFQTISIVFSCVLFK